MREVRLDPARGFDEVERVVVVLFDAGGDGEDVGIENDVLGRKTNLINEDAVGAFADADLAFQTVSLTVFVERHHDDGGAVAADEIGLVAEFFLAFLEADRVNDALALDAAETGFDDFPLRGINHDGDPRNIGLAHDEE